MSTGRFQPEHLGGAFVKPLNTHKVWVLVAGAAFTLMPLGSPATAADDRCDRACMRGVMDQYFAAVFRHDPKAAPLAANARATVNAVELEQGTGVWKSVTGYGAVERRYFDVPERQAVYFGLLSEGAEPVIVSVRLKIEGRKVSEAEWTVARKEYGGLFSIEGLMALPPRPDAAIPAKERPTRAQLIAMGNAYFDALEAKNGSRIPHIDGCERVENGVKVTHRPRNMPLGALPGAAPAAPAPTAAAAPTGMSGDCAADMETVAANITKAAHRRFPLVDEEAGVVMGTTIFHRPPGSTIKRNLLTEFFVGRNEKIESIYAAMFYLDPSAPDSPGWPVR
jgi:hypothetical protein